MRIGEHLYLVGSEQFGLSHPLDSNCYLIDGGSALALDRSCAGCRTRTRPGAPDTTWHGITRRAAAPSRRGAAKRRPRKRSRAHHPPLPTAKAPEPGAAERSRAAVPVEGSRRPVPELRAARR